tara:strand:+ start:3073 stop:3558 length:486 start_codon:yes stop_codon:yes gene_type:complete
MEITQLNNVLRRQDPTDLYNITEISFSYPGSFNFNISTYFVTEFEEMRMDLISNLIYGNTEYVDFLCSLNNIKNPLSVKRGDEILYVDVNEISRFKVSKINKDDVRKIISNRRKQSKTDPNRTKYLEEKNYSLPPTITKTDYKPIKYKEGKTHIGGDIFNV